MDRSIDTLITGQIIGRCWKHRMRASLEAEVPSMVPWRKFLITGSALALSCHDVRHNINHTMSLLYVVSALSQSSRNVDHGSMTLIPEANTSPSSLRYISQCFGCSKERLRQRSVDVYKDTLCLRVLKCTEELMAFPTFLSCGRPYSQGNPVDGPSERSSPATQKPIRTGNTLV